ncbi:MAG: aminotransferase class III-fold pyridoxal phosphate-dependent enzyme, partial [Proteobacteria bacterium]|nr:aminotransferase class III-fold pyridoxal phosphate-dependent enzyme [Pseudomonadota bacterium]
MGVIDKLNSMRNFGGNALTIGLSDELILEFAASDNDLVQAVNSASEIFISLQNNEAELLAMDETEQIKAIQNGYVNFYSDDTINPYVAIAAHGPWIITMKGAVLHDNGGYGMLGFGHTPEAVIEAMSCPQVMANIMTANIAQKKFIDAMLREIGHSRGGSPFSKFLCMNSGSEAVTVAARISDINAKLMTDPNGPKACRKIRKLGLTGAFHGRTDRPAQFSDSSRPNYLKHLATFRDNDSLITVDPNDIQQLEQVFEWAELNNVFIEAFFMEPVMGEGNPGEAVTPEFYARARELTRAHNTLFLVDSIQAGIRTHGVLSIVDYPGFEHLDAPDMETYSKALNGGQYPFSVLAMTEETAALYRKGVYGNTMTTNPRALDVA